MTASAVQIHPTAEVSPEASIGNGTRIWNGAQVREGARVGAQCVIGSMAYIDRDVVVGDRCKIENGACLFRGVTLEDGVFIGPHAALTNDRFPRAVNPDGSPQSDADWDVEATLVRHGASIGAAAVVLAGVTIGPWALVAAGAVVTASVPAHAIVRGNPARVTGWACVCGRPLQRAETHMWHCVRCDRPFHLAELST